MDAGDAPQRVQTDERQALIDRSRAKLIAFLDGLPEEEARVVILMLQRNFCTHRLESELLRRERGIDVRPRCSHCEADNDGMRPEDMA
jgi:hypothetical protein